MRSPYTSEAVIWAPHYRPGIDRVSELNPALCSPWVQWYTQNACSCLHCSCLLSLRTLQ